MVQQKRNNSNLRGLKSDRMHTLKLQLKNAEQNAKLSIGGDQIWPSNRASRAKNSPQHQNSKQLNDLLNCSNQMVLVK